MRFSIVPCAAVACLMATPLLADSLFDPDNPEAYYEASAAECQALARSRGTVLGAVVEAATEVGMLQVRVDVTSGGWTTQYRCVLDPDGAGIGPLQGL